MRSVTSLLALLGMVALAAYLTMRFRGEDKTFFVPGRTSFGHYQIEGKCESCHVERNEVTSAACLECHREELNVADDSHPPAKFRDPRNAQLLTKLNAQKCDACHTEHRPMLTGDMGVTLPGDFCFHCHQDIGDERPTHAGLDHSGCQSAGCHNFHDNRGLSEEFLEQHLGEPKLLASALRSLVPHAPVRGPKQLGADQANADMAHAGDPSIVSDWAASAHAAQGVNCSGCHGEGAAFVQKPTLEACAECHAAERDGFLAGHHGMRLAAGLTPMTPGLARLPMKADSRNRELGCNSCHTAHRYDLASAQVEGCLGCHDDQHSKAYLGSPHHALWQREQRGELPPGSGVSCATCHMPALAETGTRKAHTEHNQNDNLRPNEKMVRSVCIQCHGLGYTLDALASADELRRNFVGDPQLHVESLDWVEKRRAQRAAAEKAE